MKQSPVPPGSSPITVRINNIVGEAQTTGVTYVLQPQQQQASLKPGVLRPVSFLQQQQVNVGGGGGSNNGAAGNGGQVLIRRFPNNNVVQVRRIVNQQQQQQVQHVQRLVVQSPTLVGSPSPQNQVQIQVSASAGGTGNGKKAGVFSSESESDEFESVGKRVTRSCSSTARNLHQRNGKDASAANGRRKEVDDAKLEEDLKEADEKVKSGKRKRFDNGGVEDDDDDEGDLLIDQDEDDQDGDVIDDDDEDGDNEKSAFELNGAGVDGGFLRHVIETQILNRHKTRISDWDGTKGHMCQSCHESFLSENGLEVHRNRRIHHILFFCRYCKRDLSFFNKCRLLQHLRNHRATPTVSSLQNCIMIRLLPESDYLHYQYEDCTSSSEDDEEKVSSPGGGGGGGGTSSSNGGGSSSASKRLKPSRFRRIARSSITGRDSDNSPPPIVCRQIVAPPQQLASPTPTAENSTTTIVSTLNNSASVAHKNATGGTIKYAGANSTGGGDDQQKISPQAPNQVAVIKSGAASGKTANLEKESSPVDSSAAESPQIRIRNLSQITVTMNEEDDAEDDDMPDEFEGEDDEDEDTEKLKNVAVIQSPLRPRGKSPSKAKEAEGNSTTVIVTKKEYRCHKCDRFFRFASELFKHLEETEQVGLSTRSLHRCPNDDIPSWSQCQFVFHTKVFHEKIEPHMCPGCGHESPDYNSLLEHVTNDCFYLSQRARYMCATAAVSKCSFSDRKCVKTEPEIIDHLKKEHSRSVLQCLHCTQGFATDNWLLKHLSETHGIRCDESKSETEREALINKTTRPLTQCLICNILFPNGPTYLQHVYLNFHMHILHAKMLECQNCFAVFETNEEIFAHRKENEECRKLNPFEMKISEGSEELGRVNSPDGQGQISSSPITPATIKIVANPSVVVTKGQLQPPHLNPITQQQSIPKSQSSSSHAMITVASSANTSTNGSQPPRLSPQVIHQRSQMVQQKQTTSNQNSSSQPRMSAPQNNRNNATNTATNSRSPSPAKKNAAFDDLLSCQFCERLVVFSSLRKHEDQCCGLSTVDPGYCLTCKQHFGDKTRLARHGIVHIQEGLPICLFCNNRHIRPTHPKSTAPSAHENLYALKKHLYSNHTSKILQYPYKCTICNEWCPDKRTCEFHIKDHQFKYRLKAGERDPSPIPMSPEELQKMVRIRRKGIDPRKKATTKTIEVYYCPVCKNREFALESGLARHLKLVHQKNPKSLNLSLLKKASTARRFVVKAPESASSLMVVQQPRPLLRSVVSVGGDGGGGSNSNLASSPSNAGSRNSNNGNGNGNTVTVSSSSGTNSFTSRFSSSIVLRKRLGSVSTAATTSVRRPVASGGNLPQRQLPNTRQRTSTSSSTARTPSASSNRPPSNSSNRPPSNSSNRQPSNSSNRPPSNFLQNRPSSTAPAKSCRKRDGTITCLKCPEFSCKSENEFCEHVKWKHIWPDSEIQKLKFGSKMEEPSEYWCPECNTNFVAKPSLVRHLKFAHEYIKSAEDYMQKIGYDGKKPLKAHQCEVCYYQCADDREHQQHIRTHGMAFLRLRQQRQMSMSKS